MKLFSHCPTVVSLVCSTVMVSAQAQQGSILLPAYQPQTDTFNSDFALSKEQIASLNLSDVAANNINVATRFEQTNWATGSVLQDSFYTDLPANASSAPAGGVLKVEASTDVGNYTIAPTLALSRIVYQSKTLNGSLVPVSAYILWPFLNHGEAKKTPLVSWAHGTSGLSAECAPSHIRNLWYQFSGPYQLALAGYAVVASDYAGLGVATDAAGKPIVHQYLASPAAGNDVLYAAQAAHAAFPGELTREFVVVGHSQGGGAAWAAAEQQLKLKVPGYLGTVAVSPVTNAVEQGKLTQQADIGMTQIANSIRSIFPEVEMSDMLTAEGLALVNLVKEVQGCNSMFSTLLGAVFTANPTIAFAREDFLNSSVADEWANLTSAGGKDFAGPLLVLHGTADTSVLEQLTSAYVNATCAQFGGRGLHYVVVEGVGHVPTMYATQQLWLSWIGDRFHEKGRKKGTHGYSGHKAGKCTMKRIGGRTPRPLESYNTENLNYFLEVATSPYQVA